jgi:drug/metabolite transporter (DMT)-like permease
MVGGGAASAAAYMLVLAAARLAPLGLVAAFRESSVVFGALGAWLVLGEGAARRRVAGATAVALGLAIEVLS